MEYSYSDRLLAILESSSGGSAERVGLQRGATGDDIASVGGEDEERESEDDRVT